MYKIKVGNYVNFDVQGEVAFGSRVVIRDFSEIVVPKGSLLRLNRDVFLGKFVEVGATNIFIDNNTSVQNGTILLGEIAIGKNCLLASNIYISSGKHNFRLEPELLIKDQDRLASPQKNNITIEDDVWIGRNVVIINGVTIGKGAIIGANAFINKDVEPYSVVSGVPQKIISYRLEFQKNMPTLLEGENQAHYPYFYSGIDYSIETIKQYKLPVLEDEIFCLVVKNEKNCQHIILEFELEEENRVEYNGTICNVNKDSTIAQFMVNNEIKNQYKFYMKNSHGTVKIKRVYFND